MYSAKNNSDGESKVECSAHSPDGAVDEFHRLRFAPSSTPDDYGHFPADDSDSGKMGRQGRERAWRGELCSLKTAGEFFREFHCETTNSSATRRLSARRASTRICESVLLLRQPSAPVQKLPEEGALLQRVQEEGPSRAYVRKRKSTCASYGAEGDR